LHAQSVAAGSVLLPHGSDTVTAGRVRVVLHEVGHDSQGPIDSTIADGHGRFRMRFRADTASLYLLSARYGGIEYFSTPVHTNPSRPDTAIRLMVYDTSSSAPVGVAARHIVVPRPGEDGARAVLDLVVLRNEGSLARVAGDSIKPSWSAALPAGTAGFELGESDLSPEAVTRRGDSVLVFAPIAPGDKQLTMQYLIPADRQSVVFPMGTGGPVNLLVEESGGGISGGTIALADSQVIEGRWFHRWSGRTTVGQEVRLTLPRVGRAPRALLAGLVAALALILLLAGWRIVASRALQGEPRTPDRLLDAVAELDARYVGRQGDVPSEEWDRYQSERALLKAELEAALAGANTDR
jgi:hypothetical protein